MFGDVVLTRLSLHQLLHHAQPEAEKSLLGRLEAIKHVLDDVLRQGALLQHTVHLKSRIS